MLELVVQVLGVGGILNLVRFVRFITANGPAVIAVVGFTPPAIQHGEVEHAIDGGLHA